MKKKWQGWLIAVLGLALAVRTGSNVWTLYTSGNRLKETRQELVSAKTRNEELTLKLAEVKSPEYIEREAREKLGYGKEGEVILIMPEVIEQSSFARATEDKPNWRKWWDLYIGI